MIVLNQVSMNDQSPDPALDAPEKRPGNLWMEERRIGRFRVAAELLQSGDPILLCEFFSHFIITRAECLYHVNEIEYIAYSILFAPVSLGYEAPLYSILLTSDIDGNITNISVSISSA